LVFFPGFFVCPVTTADMSDTLSSVDDDFVSDVEGMSVASDLELTLVRNDGDGAFCCFVMHVAPSACTFHGDMTVAFQRPVCERVFKKMNVLSSNLVGPGYAEADDELSDVADDELLDLLAEAEDAEEAPTGGGEEPPAKKPKVLGARWQNPPPMAAKGHRRQWQFGHKLYALMKLKECDGNQYKVRTKFLAHWNLSKSFLVEWTSFIQFLDAFWFFRFKANYRRQYALAMHGTGKLTASDQRVAMSLLVAEAHHETLTYTPFNALSSE
jgi:hypothetical protein